MTPSSRRSVLLIVVGIVLSVGLALVLRLTRDVSAQVAFAIGLLGTLITLLLRAYVVVIERFEGLGNSLTSRFDELGNSLADRFGVLKNSVIDAAQLRALATMPDVERLVVDITERFNDLNTSKVNHAAFFWGYATSALTESKQRISEAASGVVTCIQGDEIYLVREALKCTQDSVSAIAARGAVWWSKPEADAYWEAYGFAVRDQGLRIKRIFIVDDDPTISSNVREVLDRHHRLGMETMYILRSRVGQRLGAPIVVFDKSLLHRPFDPFASDSQRVSFTRNLKELTEAIANFETVASLPDTRRWPPATS